MKIPKKNKVKVWRKSFFEIAQLWASQSQSIGKCSNGFFNDKKLYSYGHHYLLGVIGEYRGQKIAILNTKYYSKTTSGHLGDARATLLREKILYLEASDENFDFSAKNIKRLYFQKLNDFFSYIPDFFSSPNSWRRYFFTKELRQINLLANAMAFKSISIPKDFSRLMRDSILMREKIYDASRAYDQIHLEF